MTTPIVAPDVASPVSESAPDPAGGCEMCPHPVAAHDTISLRFCAATQAAAMTRGCVCPSA